MSILDDQRGQRSDELSFRADQLLGDGDEQRARELYARAAELETELAGDVPDDQQRLKSTLADAAHQGVATLREQVQQEDYLRSFATGFRDLAPKGDAVETVTYGSPSWRHEFPSYDFRPHHRQSLTRALGNLDDFSPPDSVEGYLEGMDLTVQRPWIKLECPDDESAEPERFYLHEDLSTDELGDKLHSRVRVPLESRQVGRSTHAYALDVELIE